MSCPAPSRQRRVAASVVVAASLLAACSGDSTDDGAASAPPASSTAASTNPGQSATTIPPAASPPTTNKDRGKARPDRTSTTTTLPPSPRQNIVDHVCTKVRGTSYLDAAGVIERGQERFTSNGGEGYIHTRLARRCSNALRRFQRVNALASEADRITDEVTTGIGFLDAIACTQTGMELQVTNRTDRAVGALVRASFGKGGKDVVGAPPIVVWRLGPGASVQLTAPVGTRGRGYDGLCSASAVPWLAREQPATTAAFPLRGDGRVPKLKNKRRAGIPASVRNIYGYADEFECGGSRDVLQGVTDLRSGSFDRRRSEPRCLKGEPKVYVCRNVLRSHNYAVVEMKVGPKRVSVGGRQPKRAPARVEVGVLRRSPLDLRWRWVVEPLTVVKGGDPKCSGVAALPLGAASSG